MGQRGFPACAPPPAPSFCFSESLLPTSLTPALQIPSSLERRLSSSPWFSLSPSKFSRRPQVCPSQGPSGKPWPGTARGRWSTGHQARPSISPRMLISWKRKSSNDTGEEPERMGLAFASPERPGGARGHPRGVMCPLHVAQLGTVPDSSHRKTVPGLVQCSGSQAAAA